MKHRCEGQPEHDEIEDVEYTFLKDQDAITVDGATLRVHYMPGHTWDHICLLLEEENSLFCGDAVLGEGSTVFDDLQAYMKSLAKMQTLAPAKMYPGHGPVILKPVDKIKMYMHHRNHREKQIIKTMQTLSRPCSSAEIVAKMYPELNPTLRMGAIKNVTLHLEKLAKEEHASKSGSNWVLRGSHRL